MQYCKTQIADVYPSHMQRCKTLIAARIEQTSDVRSVEAMIKTQNADVYPSHMQQCKTLITARTEQTSDVKSVEAMTKTTNGKTAVCDLRASD